MGSILHKIIPSIPWHEYPALLYGLAYLIGFANGINPAASLLIPFFLIGLSLFTPASCKLNGIRGCLALALLLAGFTWAKIGYMVPEVPKDGIAGSALIDISSVKELDSHFGNGWVYTGTIEKFYDSQDQLIASRLPFRLLMSESASFARPGANQHYRVQAMIKTIDNGIASLKVRKQAIWYPEPFTYSVAEKRFSAKKSFESYITQYYEGASAKFITGLATGELNDRLMANELSRLGVQHLMAVSGFHFSLAAALLGILARSIFGPRPAAIAILILLTAYFLFLGPLPSVMRAWIASSIVFTGLLFAKRTTPLNSLGAALLISLLYDPMVMYLPGFQFSFLVTASIILLYKPFEKGAGLIFPKRPLSIISEMSLLDQHAYLLLTFFKKTLALGFAVNAAALPLTLYYFQKFPLISLIWNLFFPFLAGLAITLLLLGLLLTVISPLASLIHSLNDTYIAYILHLINAIPLGAEYWVYNDQLAGSLLVLYFSILFLLCFYQKKNQEELIQFYY